MPSPVYRSRRLWPALLALGLTVFGARLWLVHQYGSAMPFWDQWPGEGWLLLKPWREGRLTWEMMVAPHLEHRIFWTRALILGLFELNAGQWDALVEMTANAAIFTLVLLGVTAVAARAVPGRGWRCGLLAGAAVLGTLPFAWENTLAGFQSQFYILLGCSLWALRGLGTRPAGAMGWWTGLIAAVAACLSMGSGPLAAMVAGVWTVAVILRGWRRPTRGEWVTMLACAVIGGTGLAFRAEVPGHAALRAGDAAAWGRGLGHTLAWPWSDGSPWLALVLYFPLAALFAFWLWRPARSGVFAGTLLVGAWVLLQAGAIAYARGGDGRGWPASRYQDLLATGVAVNLLAAWLLATRVRPANPFALTAGSWRAFRGLALAGAAAWTVLLGVGLGRQTVNDFRANMPARRDGMKLGAIKVRAFLRGDQEALLRQLPFTIPYPDGGDLGGFLSDPFIRSTLPAVIRPPLALEPEDAAGTFTPDGMAPALQSKNPPAWGSGEPGRTGEFRARLNPAPRLPYLRWELAGDLGAGGTDLALRVEDAAGGHTETVHPFRPAGGKRWRPEFAAVPAGAARVVATDHDAEHGFAFRAPVEVGPLSRWVEWLLRRGAWVFGAGVLGLLWEVGRRPPGGGSGE